MARNITAAPVPTSTPTLRMSWRFGAQIAVIIVATLLLVTWTVSELRTTNAVDAVPAPMQQSIRQVEHADQVRDDLRRLNDIEVQRFGNRSSALTPEQPNPEVTQRIRPGVQP